MAVSFEAVCDSFPRLKDVAQALTFLDARSAIGKRDLVPLLRQGLYAYGRDVEVQVPRLEGWPSIGEWEQGALSLVRADVESLVLRVRPWAPRWLAADQADRLRLHTTVINSPPDQRRRPSERQADPFLIDLLGEGFFEYRSPGQQQATRACMSVANGSTVIVNLPTGDGKTLVALLPILRDASLRRLSLLVVPTTALALDLERRIQPFLKNAGTSPALAYVGGGGDREVARAQIRDRLAKSEQRLVITSPESASGALQQYLCNASSRGELSNFIIDEAHLVDQWGADFRPAFQKMAALRRSLLSLSAGGGHETFRTLLMSATLTEHTFGTLVRFFGDPGPVISVGAPALRPEPDYWVAPCSSKEERRTRLLELMAVAPRPVIVYTSEKKQADGLVDLLRSNGYARVEQLTGDTPGDARLDLLRKLRGAHEGGDLRGTSVDVVVGTSAFGLGIDQADVRCVIHACIPENLDRYYQEVGRGGRDGQSCLAILLPTPEDERVARSLAFTDLIGSEKGFNRWQAMLASAGATGEDGLLRVDSRVVPSHVSMPSDKNVHWNLRTLTLMERAGVIALHTDPPPSRGKEESLESWDARKEAILEKFKAIVPLRLKHGQLNEFEWEREVTSAAKQMHANDERGLEAMYSVVRRESRLCDLLADTYEVPPNTSGMPDGTRPAISCGQCWKCRAAPHEHGIAPVARLRRGSAWPRWSQWLHQQAKGEETLHVFYERPKSIPDSESWDRKFGLIFQRFVDLGIRHVVSSQRILAFPSILEAHRRTPERYLFTSCLETLKVNEVPPVPTLIVQDPRPDELEVPPWLWSLKFPQKVLLIADDAVDPEVRTELAKRRRRPQMLYQAVHTQ